MFTRSDKGQVQTNINNYLNPMVLLYTSVSDAVTRSLVQFPELVRLTYRALV